MNTKDLPRNGCFWTARDWCDLHREVERVKKRLREEDAEEEASRDLTEDIVDLEEDQLPF